MSLGNVDPPLGNHMAVVSRGVLEPRFFWDLGRAGLFLRLCGVIFGGTSLTMGLLGSALVHPANGVCKEKPFEYRGLAPGCPPQALGGHREGVALRSPHKPCSLCLRQRRVQVFVRGDGTCAPHPGVLGK